MDALQELIKRECRHEREKWLIVGPQAVTGNPSKGVDPLVSCPSNAVLAHFNGLRGVDAYKLFDGIILIGRNQPPIDALEELARALWYDSPDALSFATDWVVTERPYRLRGMGGNLGVEVLIHPDARIQRLHAVSRCAFNVQLSCERSKTASPEWKCSARSAGLNCSQSVATAFPCKVRDSHAEARAASPKHFYRKDEPMNPTS